MVWFVPPSRALGADMIRSAVLATALLQAAVAAAQDSPAAASPPADTGSPASMHVHNYGAFDLTCLRWTDGCRTCGRGTDGEATCSNIGIACQPAEVKCIAQKQEPPQK
jgi:hypothetical protein